MFHPRLFYVDPSIRLWKGEIPYDLPVISALSTDEDEFLVYSKPNEDKLDKEPVWSFQVLPSCDTSIQAIDWIKAIRQPRSVTDMVLSGFPWRNQVYETQRPSTSSSSPSPSPSLTMSPIGVASASASTAAAGQQQVEGGSPVVRRLIKRGSFTLMSSSPNSPRVASKDTSSGTPATPTKIERKGSFLKLLVGADRFDDLTTTPPRPSPQPNPRDTSTPTSMGRLLGYNPRLKTFHRQVSTRIHGDNHNADIAIQGPLLMRELSGPKRYFQRYFALEGTNLIWSGVNETQMPNVDDLRCGLTLTSSCRVRLLSAPKLLPNLPNFAFWIYVPMREKPLKFRTLDLNTAQKWVEQIGFAIALCERQTLSGKRDVLLLARLLLEDGRDLMENKHSFLSAKIKFKEALDMCETAKQKPISEVPVGTTQESRLEAIEKIEFTCLELRARCNFVLGLFEKSLEDISKALSLNPKDETGLRIKAACLEKLERFPECLELYQEIAAFFPDSSSELKEICERIQVLAEKFEARNKLSKQAGSESFKNKRPAIARQNSNSSSSLLIEFPSTPSSAQQISKRRIQVDTSSSINSNNNLASPHSREHALASISTVSNEESTRTMTPTRLNFSNIRLNPSLTTGSSPSPPPPHPTSSPIITAESKRKSLTVRASSFHTLDESKSNDQRPTLSLAARAETVIAKRLSLRMAELNAEELEAIRSEHLGAQQYD